MNDPTTNTAPVKAATFDFNGVTLRPVIRDGAPWFVVKELCGPLGYRDASNAARHVATADKGTQIVSTRGGAQRLMVVNESGLYTLILKSRKPEAQTFKHWVTSDVLPSIRKHGAYAQGADQLPEETQAKLYADFRGKITEAQRMHDHLTQHDHFHRSLEVRREGSRLASQEVALALGLPFHTVAAVASLGVDKAMVKLGPGLGIK